MSPERDAATADGSGPEAAGPWFVVGLGNPGAGYAGNRHNVGQMVLDELAGRAGVTLRAHKGIALVGEGRIGIGPGGAPGPKVLLARPTSYMNVSGGPVASVLRYYGLAPERLLVVHDELDLAFATLRLKRGGGEGGHNGLRDVTRATGTRDYVRLRVGVDRPPGRMDPADYVLRDFSAGERRELPFVLGEAADAVEHVVTGGLEVAQRDLHTRSV